MHTPVLLNEVLEIIDPRPGMFVIDGTANGGGHAVEVLKRISPGGKLLAIEWDSDVLKEFVNKLEGISNMASVLTKNESYTAIPQILKEEKLGGADALLLDLGFSSTQIDSSGRGFSFQRGNEPLDMRYNPKSNELTAAEIVNSWNKDELSNIFKEYGEERFSRRIAEEIVKVRKEKKILIVKELVDVVKSSVPGGYERGRIHPATRIFQALRIEVNNELENISEILKNLDAILKPDGVAVIISFHSLEDRVVKNEFRKIEQEGNGKRITKKPIRATEEECRQNPRSKPAKLRALRLTK